MTKVVFVTTLLLLGAVALASDLNVQSTPSWRQNLKAEVAQLGLAADVTATLEESLFAKICNTVVPLINQYVQGLVIPGESKDHFSFDNVVIQEFHIDSLSITFASPTNIKVSLTDISFSIPHTHFDIWEKIIFKITCSGSFWASMTGTSIYLTLAAMETDGKLAFGDAQSSVTWGNLNIQHDFPNFFCKVGQDIVQLFVGNIDDLIKKLVEQDLPAKIGPMIQAALDTALAKLPLDFVSQPVVTSDSISLTVDLLGGAGVVRAVQVKPPTHSARSALLSPRDIELQIPEAALNNLLTFETQAGKLNMNVTEAKFNTSAIRNIFPSVYAECPDCPFALEVNAVDAPTTTFANDSIALTVTNAILGLNIRAPNATIIPFLDLWVNASLAVMQLGVVGNNTLYFQLGMRSFNLGIRHSAIGPIDISLISSVVSFALDDILIPDFNHKFHGIPLPAMATSAEVVATSTEIVVAFNILL